jgi:phage gp36-like protein
MTQPPGDTIDPTIEASVYGITVADLAARLTPRTLAAVTDDDTGRNVDAQLVMRAVLDAEATFHTYAGVYYVVPIEAPAESVRVARKIVIDLAAWELLSRRPHAIAGDVGESERTRYDAALAWLKALGARDRRVQLTGAAERVSLVPLSGGAAMESDAPQFGGDALAEF